MICPKCGSQIMDGSDFCMNCGVNIAQFSQSRRKEKTTLVFAALVLLIVIAIFSVALYMRNQRNQFQCGRYQLYDATSVSLTFLSDGTFKEQMGSNTYTGTWERSGNVISTICDMEQFTSYGKFEMLQGYLVYIDGIQNVSVPNGKHFDLEIKDDDGSTEFEFHKDGNLEFFGYSGTYTRNGHMITYRLDGDDEDRHLLICDDSHISSGFYMR